MIRKRNEIWNWLTTPFRCSGSIKLLVRHQPLAEPSRFADSQDINVYLSSSRYASPSSPYSYNVPTFYVTMWNSLFNVFKPEDSCTLYEDRGPCLNYVLPYWYIPIKIGWVPVTFPIAVWKPVNCFNCAFQCPWLNQTRILSYRPQCNIKKAAAPSQCSFGSSRIFDFLGTTHIWGNSPIYHLGTLPMGDLATPHGKFCINTWKYNSQRREVVAKFHIYTPFCIYRKEHTTIKLLIRPPVTSFMESIHKVHLPNVDSQCIYKK